jgi:similar to stage IV sporulation protein
LDKNLIERQLKEDFPDATYINLQIIGTMVNIEIVEKVLPPELEREKLPAHLLARRDGIIEDVVVMAGDPKVKPGDTVRTGQLLISGIVPPAAAQEQMPGVILPPAIETEPKYVHARGLVRARVWYEGYGDAYLIEREELDSGEKARQLWITYGNKEVLVWGPRNIPYANHRRDQEEKKWQFAGAKVVNYYGVIINEVVLGPAGAQRVAAERAMKQIQGQLLNVSKMVQENVELIPVEDGNLVRVRVRIEAIEDIGREELFMHP